MRKLRFGIALAGLLMSSKAAQSQVIPLVSGYTVHTIATNVPLIGRDDWCAIDPATNAYYMIGVLPSDPTTPVLQRFTTNGTATALGPLQIPGTLKFHRTEQRLYVSHPANVLGPGNGYLEAISTTGASVGSTPLPIGENFPNAPIAIGPDGRVYTVLLVGESLQIQVLDSGSQTWSLWRTVPLDLATGPNVDPGRQMYMEFSVSGQPMLSFRGALYRAAASGLQLVAVTLLEHSLAVGGGFALLGNAIVDPEGAAQFNPAAFMTGAQGPTVIGDDGSVIATQITGFGPSTQLGSIVILSRTPVGTTKASWTAVKKRFQ